MTVCIVSRNTIFRTAVAQLCTSRGLPITDTVDSCLKLTPANIGRVLLLHVLDHDSPVNEKIEGVLGRFGNLRIVVVVPDGFDQTFDGKYDNRITVTIPDTVPSETLISALHLADLGYSIRPPNQSRPASETVAETTTHLPVAHIEDRADGSDGNKTFLSHREIAVLAHLCSGNSNKAIARSLGICDATVKAHLRSSFRRIGAANRTQAAMWASQNLQAISDKGSMS